MIGELVECFGSVQVSRTLDDVKAQIDRDAAVAMEAIGEATERARLFEANEERNQAMAERERRMQQEAKTEMLPVPPSAPPETSLSTFTPVTEDEVREILRKRDVQQAMTKELLEACKARGLIQPLAQDEIEATLVDPFTGVREALPQLPPGPMIPMFAKSIDPSLLTKLINHYPGHLNDYDPKRVGVDPEVPLPCETKKDMMLIMAHAKDRVMRSERVALGRALIRLAAGLEAIRDKELERDEPRRLEA